MAPNPLRPSSAIPTNLLLSTTRPSPRSTVLSHTHNQTRHATLIRRPHRPYTFTQLLTLSDGSTFLHRTTSPAPVYRSTRDTRNTPLWNPSSVKLATVEEDEAGRLRAFRRKFGRGWDAETRPEALDAANAVTGVPLVEGGARDSALEAESVTVGVQKGERREIVGGGGKGGKKMEAREAAEGALNAPEEKTAEKGRGWDKAAEDNLMDLIGSFGQTDREKEQQRAMASGVVRRIGQSSGKKK